MEAYLRLGIVVLVLAIFAIMLRMYLSPWLKCRSAGYPLGLFDLVHIVTRGAKTGPVSNAYLLTRKAGMIVSIQDLTALYLASPRTFPAEVKRLIEGARRR